MIPDDNRRLLMLKEIPYGNLDHATGIGGMAIHWAVPTGISLSITAVPDDQKSTFIGSWSAITMTHEDPVSPAPSVTYSIAIGGIHSTLYSVTGNWLNYDGANWTTSSWTPTITINVVDLNGGMFAETFTLGFTRVPKAPTVVWTELPWHPDTQMPISPYGDK